VNVYLDKDESLEIDFVNDDDKTDFYKVRVELSPAQYEQFVQIRREYWQMQSVLEKLYEKSTRRDKR
jgi:hypothetical protein